MWWSRMAAVGTGNYGRAAVSPLFDIGRFADSSVVDGPTGGTGDTVLLRNPRCLSRMPLAGAEISSRTNLTGHWGRANAAPFDFQENVI